MYTEYHYLPGTASPAVQNLANTKLILFQVFREEKDGAFLPQAIRHLSILSDGNVGWLSLHWSLNCLVIKKAAWQDSSDFEVG
jgi:hypothetical protein